MNKRLNIKNNKIYLLISVLTILACMIIAGAFATIKVKAATPSDEIVNYTITVDVNDDATLNMKYHIDYFHHLISIFLKPIYLVY